MAMLSRRERPHRLLNDRVDWLLDLYNVYVRFPLDPCLFVPYFLLHNQRDNYAFFGCFFRGLLQGVPGGHWAFFPRVVRHLKRRVWEGGGASQMEMVVLRVYESRVVEVYEMRWASIF